MEGLDQLISLEERKIEQLSRMRRDPGAARSDGRRHVAAAEIDNDIEKAYEQLAIYKIRKMMGF
jgi:hypothetical protein